MYSGQAKLIKILGKKHTLLKDIKGWADKPKIRCNKHNVIWGSRTDSILSGNVGCPKCRSEINLKRFLDRTKTPEYKIFILKQKERNTKSLSEHRKNIKVKLRSKPNIRLLKIWQDCSRKNITTRVRYKCVPCNHVWETRVDSTVGCRKCVYKTISRVNRKPVDALVCNNKEYVFYRNEVHRLSGLVYKRYKHLINPDDLKRGYHYYHLDHIFSISSGWLSELKNPPLIQELAHPCNLRMLPKLENIHKNSLCHISITELRRRIRIWNKKYGKPFSCYAGCIQLKDS